MNTTTSAPTQEERNLALLMHILAFFTGFIGPLVIWLVKKDESEFLDQHGRDALNFQISLLIYSLVVGLIALVTCGFGGVLVIPLIIYVIVGCVMAAIQGHKGEACEYPLTIRLLK